MRCLLVAAAVSFIVSGCSILQGNGTTGGGGTTTPEAGTPCDGKNDCSTCVTCAEQNLCAAQLATCNQDSECVGIVQCYSACGTDPNCRAQCQASNPDGVADFTALAQCDYCSECPSDCAGFLTCQ